MARLEFEVHKRHGRKGVFYMGNLKFPATVETDDLVGFFFIDVPNGSGAHLPDRAFIAIEPRRGKADDDDENSPRRPR